MVRRSDSFYTNQMGKCQFIVLSNGSKDELCAESSVTHNQYLIRDKAAAAGQDNIQHVAGEMLSFWSQLGFVFGKFPFVGWSRGWYAEDMENNYDGMMSANESPMKRDIMRTVLGAVEMAALVKKNKYDEHVLTL